MLGLLDLDLVCYGIFSLSLTLNLRELVARTTLGLILSLSLSWSLFLDV